MMDIYASWKFEIVIVLDLEEGNYRSLATHDPLCNTPNLSPKVAEIPVKGLKELRFLKNQKNIQRTHKKNKRQPTP